MPANATSPFLAERLIARLSQSSRAELARRVLDGVKCWEQFAESKHFSSPKTDAALARQYRMLGRIAALA